MATLKKQLLVRVSDELDELITRAYSKFLGETGNHITRSDFIRHLIETQCDQELSETSKEESN